MYMFSLLICSFCTCVLTYAIIFVQLTRRDCGHCSEILEPFLDLSLEITQVDNLVAALESFTKVEQMSDAENKLTCDSCNAQVCKDKRLVIDKGPDFVAFQLKRFNTLDNSIQKIDKHVAYTLELDLKLFHSNPEKEVSCCAIIHLQVY